MEKYINDFDKEAYRNVVDSSPFSADLFHVPSKTFEDDEQVAFHSNLGSLTVLDRVTGYGNGIRDTETGYRAVNGDFWLASGGYDVRESGCETIGEAIAWVKRKANTCIPDQPTQTQE